MAKREYSFYPGCSSQKGASSSNYRVSVQTMCEELDIQLNEIPDWNCCSASIGYAGGGTRNLIVNRPIQNMDELKGLPMRVMGAPIQTRIFEAVGAAASITPVWMALYTSL